MSLTRRALCCDGNEDGDHDEDVDAAQPLIQDEGHVSHQVVNGMMAMVEIMVLMMFTRKSAPSYLFLAA